MHEEDTPQGIKQQFPLLKYCCAFALLLLALAVLAVVLLVRSFTPPELTGDPIEIAWQFKISGSTNARVQDISDKGDLLLGVGGTIRVVSQSGEVIAEIKDPGDEDAAYLQFAPGDRIYAATHAGQLYCLDYSGNILWSEYLCGKFGVMNAQQQCNCHCCMIAVRSDGNVVAVGGSGDAGVFSPEGEALEGFHAPQHFYHSELMVLLTDEIFAAADDDDTVYVYTTAGELLGSYASDGMNVAYAARGDGGLLICLDGSQVIAIGRDGKELWRYGGKKVASLYPSYTPVYLATGLPDNASVVMTDKHLTLLSDDGKQVWRKKLGGEGDDCYVNGRYIDCIIRQAGGPLDFDLLMDLTAKFDRPRYLVRYDLTGEEVATWALPPRTWEVYGPGPEGEYYTHQDDERSEFPTYYPVDFMRVELPATVSTDG